MAEIENFIARDSLTRAFRFVDALIDLRQTSDAIKPVSDWASLGASSLFSWQETGENAN